MRPVLLLDMRIVVFLVRAAAGELDLLGLTVRVQMKIDELGAVVRVDALQAKRQLRPQLLERRPDAHLALARARRRFDPRRVNVGQIERVREVAVGAIARVRHQIDLRKARLVHVPPIRPERNVVFEQRARLRPPILASLNPLTMRPEQAIDLPRTDPAAARLGRRRAGSAADAPTAPTSATTLSAAATTDTRRPSRSPPTPALPPGHSASGGTRGAATARGRGPTRHARMRLFRCRPVIATASSSSRPFLAIRQSHTAPASAPDTLVSPVVPRRCPPAGTPVSVT